MNAILQEEVEDREKWLQFRQMCGDYEATFFALEEADPWYDLEWVKECCHILGAEKPFRQAYEEARQKEAGKWTYPKFLGRQY